MRTRPSARRLAFASLAMPLVAITLFTVPASASSPGGDGGPLGWTSTSSAANVIPGPSSGGASPDYIIGGGGGAAMLGVVPYFAPAQEDPNCNSTCQTGWTDLIDNGAGNGGPVQYVIVNICVPETISRDHSREVTSTR